jgi:hypothetical protein
MSLVKDTFRELIARRLWPIAVLLLVAAVAAPLLLKSEPKAPVAAATPAVAAGDDALTAEPVITASVDAGTNRRVLGARKDPFKPTGDQPRAAAAEDPATPEPTNPEATPTGGGADPGSTGGGSVTGGGALDRRGGASPSLPDATPPPAPSKPKPTYDLYSLIVRIDEGKRQNVKRLDPLLSREDPAIIYLGLLEDERRPSSCSTKESPRTGTARVTPARRTASGSTAQGRYGVLHSRATEGVTTAPEGDTPGQALEFQLDILEIKTRSTTSASTARKARTTASAAGRRALRARVSRMGRLRYDRRTGTLHKLSVKAYRSSMARASRRRAGLASAGVSGRPVRARHRPSGGSRHALVSVACSASSQPVSPTAPA